MSMDLRSRALAARVKEELPKSEGSNRIVNVRSRIVKAFVYLAPLKSRLIPGIPSFDALQPPKRA